MASDTKVDIFREVNMIFKTILYPKHIEFTKTSSLSCICSHFPHFTANMKPLPQQMSPFTANMVANYRCGNWRPGSQYRCMVANYRCMVANYRCMVVNYRCIHTQRHTHTHTQAHTHTLTHTRTHTHTHTHTQTQTHTT